MDCAVGHEEIKLLFGCWLMGICFCAFGYLEPDQIKQAKKNRQKAVCSERQASIT
jgi:hypothetical protein